MRERSFGNYFFEKLLFPKIYLVDSPGVIISKSSTFFGKDSRGRRALYHFSDIFIELQLSTIKKMGDEAASLFFYKIGKDLGVGFMLLGNAKRAPSVLLPSILNSICKLVSFTGAMGPCGVETLGDKTYSFDREGGFDYNVEINNSFFSGVYSGILSFLTGENYDAEDYRLNCCSDYKIIVKKTDDGIYYPNFEKLKLPSDYFKVNSVPSSFCPSGTSFSDLLRFGKVVSRESGVYYEGFPVFSTEQNMFDLIAKHYIEEGFEDFFREEVVRISESFGKKLFVSGNSKANFEKMLNMFCAFGWGVPRYFFDRDKLELCFSYAPISKNVPLYRALVINGFLNSIFDKNYSLDFIDGSLGSSKIRIYYNIF